MDQVNISELKSNLFSFLKKAQQDHSFMATTCTQILAIVCAPEAQQKNARNTLKQVAKTAIVDDVIAPINEPWERQL